MTPWTSPEYWSGQPFPSPGDLPNPEIEPRSPALQADSLPAEPHGKFTNTGVGSLSLLQQMFPVQKPGSAALQADSLPTELIREAPDKVVMCNCKVVLPSHSQIHSINIC